jgi:uncharacterized protein (DUF697 family)
MTPTDPYVTIDEAAMAAEFAVGTERSPKALIRLQMGLVQDLGRTFGRELTKDEAAALTLLFGRMVVPLLGADLVAETVETHLLTAEDAAHVTACIGVNVLGTLHAASIGEA